MAVFRRHLRLLVLCALVAELSHYVRAANLPDVSFQPPFELLDKDNRRIVNTTWSHGGDADVKKHFVRLTTDRQSKRGFVWQQAPVNRDELSVILTFRISGQGKRWFGDGIALWLTDQTGCTPGTNHGFTDKYTGIGIVIDTFENADHAGGHKDISVFVNDGSKSYDQMYDETRVGCNADVRYHEQSASFNPVHSVSRIKVRIDKTRLVVEVDDRASGQWVACHEMTLPFRADWLKTSTIGITASTGALADNHDIIRFDAFSEFEDEAIGAVDTEAAVNAMSKEYKKWIDSPYCDTDCVLSLLQKEMSNFRVDAEHRFLDVKEKTMNTIAKLRKQEVENERRVREIEVKVSRGIESSLETTNKALGDEVQEKITRQLVENPDVAGGGWKTPFALLFIGLVAGAAYVYRKYQSLMKSHLL